MTEEYSSESEIHMASEVRLEMGYGRTLRKDPVARRIRVRRLTVQRGQRRQQPDERRR